MSIWRIRVNLASLGVQTLAIGPYDLLQTAGAGGAATVYRARHRALGVQVAIKVFRGKGVSPQSLLQALRWEVRAVAALEHPGVIWLLEFGAVTAESARLSAGMLSSGAAWLAVEWCSGGTLRSRCGRMAWPQVRHVLLSLLDVLAHSHARGVLHLDVKADNVLLATGDDLRPGYKLADFGLARVVWPALSPPVSEVGGDQGLPPLRVRGTPAWMPPEQFRSDPGLLGPWSDLYTMGGLTWALLTGRPLFPYTALKDLVHAHESEPRPTLPHGLPVPGFVQEWMNWLLSPAPRDRPQSAAEAAWELLRLDPSCRLEQEVLGLPVFSSWSGQGVSPVSSRSLKVPHDWRPAGLVPEATNPLVWRRVRPPEPPLLAREPIQDQLWGMLVQACEGAGLQVALLTGGAGTGKSRLARWLGRRAGELGVARVLASTPCSGEMEADPLTEMWRVHFGVVGLGVHRTRQRVEQELRELGEEDVVEVLALAEAVAPGVHEQGPAGEKVRLESETEVHNVWIRHIARLTRHKPLLLWLDDLHAHARLLPFLQSLLSHAEELPGAMVVATFSDEGLLRAPRLAGAWEELLHHPAARRIELTPLPEAAQRELVRHFVGRDGPLASRLVERAGGNPLLAVHLARELSDRRLLGPTRSFGPSESLDLRIPDDLEAVWRARLQHVLQGRPLVWQKVLALGATLGTRIDLAQWRQACEALKLMLDMRMVDLLLDRGLLIIERAGEDGDRVSFVHGMLRDTVLRISQEEGHRAELHRACAQVLTPTPGSDDVALIGRWARHLAEGEDWSAAAPALLRAAALLRQQARHEEARELLDELEIVIGHLSEDEVPPWRVWSMTERAHLLYREGRFGESSHWVRLAIAQARQLGRQEEMAVALNRLGSCHFAQGDLQASQRAHAEALALARKVGAAAVECRALIGLANIARIHGDVTRATALGESIVALATAAGEPDERRGGLVTLIQLAIRRGDLDQAERHLQELLQVAREVGSLRSEAEALQTWSTVMVGRGQGQRALELARASLRLVEKAGAIDALAGAWNELGEAHRAVGGLREAEAAYRKVIHIQRTLGVSYLQVPLLNLATVLLEMGQLEEARAVAAEGREVADRLGDRSVTFSHLLLEARTLAGLGRVGEIAPLVQQATELLAGLSHIEEDDLSALAALRMVAEEEGAVEVGEVLDRLLEGAAAQRSSRSEE